MPAPIDVSCRAPSRPEVAVQRVSLMTLPGPCHTGSSARAPKASTNVTPRVWQAAANRSPSAAVRRFCSRSSIGGGPTTRTGHRAAAAVSRMWVRFWTDVSGSTRVPPPFAVVSLTPMESTIRFSRSEGKRDVASPNHRVRTSVEVSIRMPRLYSVSASPRFSDSTATRPTQPRCRGSPTPATNESPKKQIRILRSVTARSCQQTLDLRCRVRFRPEVEGAPC